MEEIIIEELNVLEKIIFKVLKKYTIKVYKAGVKCGFNWNEILH